MKKKIKQKHYHDIEVDSNEKDIIQIWGFGKHIWGKKSCCEVVQIERRNIPAVIEALQSANR